MCFCFFNRIFASDGHDVKDCKMLVWYKAIGNVSKDKKTEMSI